MAEIKVGTRVICVKAWDGNERAIFEVGTVFKIDTDSSYLVEFDRDIGGHDGDGLHKDGHCWCFYPEDNHEILEYLVPFEENNPTIEISFDEVFS